MKRKTCIIIGGPTAVGKTALAVSLARRLNTSILSADSRQCFRELHIGVAKPSAEELAAVKHHFIDTHSINETVSAADYERYALASLQEIFTQADQAVVVGGTGLYIKALMEGLDAIPAVPSELREAIIRSYDEGGMEWLREAVQKEDPLFFAAGENRNPQRLMRALEVKRATGESILDFRGRAKPQRPFDFLPVRLTLPREKLNSGIDARVDRMVDAGLETEARALYEYRHCNALQTVGYQEFFDHFDGLCTRDEAISSIKLHTRHYAKRQETWFKKYLAAQAFGPDGLQPILEMLQAST